MEKRTNIDGSITTNNSYDKNRSSKFRTSGLKRTAHGMSLLRQAIPTIDAHRSVGNS